MPRLAFTARNLKVCPSDLAGGGAEHLLNEVASVVDLSYDPVGVVLVVESYRAFGPGVGGHASRAVGENVAALVPVNSGDHDAGLVASCVGSYGGVYGHDDFDEAFRGALYPSVVYPLSLPECIF